jgi:cyanophycinase-like exopeptidase
LSGTIALHGGGEFLAGDEPFLRALIEAAPRTDGVVRAVVIPTAAARGRPDLAGANGVDALTRVGWDGSVRVLAQVLSVVDAASAADPDLATRAAAAGLIHLPGGDPDLIPAIYPGTAVWAAIQAAVRNGVVLAGASAGAMALGERTWTRAGLVSGLGLVPGIIVVPHASAATWATSVARTGGALPADLALLGIAERTGVLIRPGGPWRVVGEGDARWLPTGRRHPDDALVIGDGGAIDPGAG